MLRAPNANRGFTLVEMMVLIGILGLVAVIAVPSFSGFMRANRIDTASDQLSSDLALARSIAVSQSQVIFFEGFETNYRISNPTSGRVIRERDYPDEVRLAADVAINFFPWGAAEAATLDLNNGHEGRQLLVLPTGIVEVAP
jgi:type II secretion system protein H